MKQFSNVKFYLYNILKESLTSPQKQMVDEWIDSNKNRADAVPFEVHNKLFADHNNGDDHADRAVIPFNGRVTESDATLNRDIAKHLHENGGWTVHDYKQGIATRKLVTKKGFVKPEFKSIGSILQETNGATKMGHFPNASGDLIAKPLLKGFNEDPIRQNKSNSDLQIVLSRHPYDVASMSTNRGWTSCMRLPGEHESGGCNHHYIQQDLHHKTMVAYLTHKGDDLAERPLARIAIKRFRTDILNDKGERHDIWRPETRVYGTAPDAMLSTVHKITADYYPMMDGKDYEKHPHLYNDSGAYLDRVRDSRIGTPKSPIDEYRPKTVHSSKINEFNQLHTDNDEPSLDFTNHAGVRTKLWHSNGVLHRENGPAFIASETHNGHEIVSTKKHYLYGMTHDPKDGSPSSEYTELSHSGEVLENMIHHRKFGKMHTGVMSGFSHLKITRRGLILNKHFYGELHTDDDKPSDFDIAYHDNGNINHIKKRWHQYGTLTKRDDSEYHQDGKPKSIRYNNIGGDAHEWDGNGTTGSGEIKKAIMVDNRKIFKKINYNNSTPTETPHEDNITRTAYTDIRDQYTPGPNGEPSILRQSRNKDGSQYFHKKWFNADGEEHSDTGFSTQTYDMKDGKVLPRSFYLEKNHRGSIPRLEDVQHGELVKHKHVEGNKVASAIFADKSHPKHVYVSESYHVTDHDPFELAPNRHVISREYSLSNRHADDNRTDGPNGEPHYVNRSRLYYEFMDHKNAGKFPKLIQHVGDSEEEDFSNVKRNLKDYYITGVKTQDPNVTFDVEGGKTVQVHHPDKQYSQTYEFNKNNLTEAELHSVDPYRRGERVVYSREGKNHVFKHLNIYGDEVDSVDPNVHIDKILAEHGHTRDSIKKLKLDHFVKQINIPSKWSDLKVKW